MAASTAIYCECDNLYFVNDTHKVITSLVLDILVLVLLELKQWLPAKCYCGVFTLIDMLSSDNDLSGRQKRFHACKVFVFGKDYLEIKEMILWFGGWSKGSCFTIYQFVQVLCLIPFILLISFSPHSSVLISSFPGSVPVIIYACHYASKQVRRGVIFIQKHLILICCTCGLIRLDKSHFGLSPDHTIEELQVRYWCMI
jgi:hypothetical protein